MTKLFIYGTLKKGYIFNDKYLASAMFIGPVVTSTDYSLYVDGLPFMVQERADKGVKGELYEVDDETLDSIDALEGHPNVYKRCVIDVYMPDGSKVGAWAYLRPASFKTKPDWKEYEFI